MFAHKHLCRFVHGDRIYLALLSPAPAKLQNQRRPAVGDFVDIRSTCRRKTGMEIFIHNGGVKHGNFVGFQMIVHGFAYFVCGSFGLEVEMANLGQGVNARIGSPCPEYSHLFTAEGSNRLLQRLLHTKAVILTLPADKAGTVVFNRNFESHHGPLYPRSVEDRKEIIVYVYSEGFMSTENENPILDSDRDSLHVLPLAILPLGTLALKRARMIKNVRLDSVIEFFNDRNTGSGQMDVSKVGSEFDWPDNSSHPDMVLLRKLGQLPSFDVYSLRIMLRRHGIKVDEQKHLKLSQTKTRELTDYMSKFTLPLIKEIYGSDDREINSFEDIIALFRDPDVNKARQKLSMMAEKLGIELADIPAFLEDYGDIFLSLSYYRQCLDRIEPVLREFIAAMSEIRANHQLQQDRNLMTSCDVLERTIKGLIADINAQFDSFNTETREMWDNISEERFNKIKAMIESYHTYIGGVLCALSVKAGAWGNLFPGKAVGGPVKRGEFILTEMKQGIEKIQGFKKTQRA